MWAAINILGDLLTSEYFIVQSSNFINISKSFSQKRITYLTSNTEVKRMRGGV